MQRRTHCGSKIIKHLIGFLSDIPYKVNFNNVASEEFFFPNSIFLRSLKLNTNFAFEVIKGVSMHLWIM